MDATEDDKTKSEKNDKVTRTWSGPRRHVVYRHVLPQELCNVRCVPLTFSCFEVHGIGHDVF